MSQDQLKASIAEVKVLMQTALDGRERDLLGGIMTHISGGSVRPEVIKPVHAQLDAQAVEFESLHPKLARSIREVMDSLNKMGV